PDISPFSFLIRYLTARTPSPYLVAIPNSAVIHIQNTAPGPPSTQAVATPAILPVPIVADSAVISEANWEISPECSGCLPKTCLKASGNIRNCQHNKRKVRNNPVPTISTSIYGPQTQPLKVSIKLCKFCIKFFLLIHVYVIRDID